MATASRPVAPKTMPPPAVAIPAPVQAPAAAPPALSPEDRPADARAGAGSNPPSSQSETATTAPSPSGLVALHLPGRIPDSIVTDKAAGTIRQVYASDTPQEIVIVQRIKSSTSKASPLQAKTVTMREADTNKSAPYADVPTIVTVTIQGQEVTLEGRQTRQELLDIAKTLVP